MSKYVLLVFVEQKQMLLRNIAQQNKKNYAISSMPNWTPKDIMTPERFLSVVKPICNNKFQI